MHCHSNLFVVHCLSFLTQRIDSIYSSNNAVWMRWQAAPFVMHAFLMAPKPLREQLDLGCETIVSLYKPADQFSIVSGFLYCRQPRVP
jgi:hypothetical protein